MPEMQEPSKSTGENKGSASQSAPEPTLKFESPDLPGVRPLASTSSLAELSSNLSYASAFPVGERTFPRPPNQIWQAVKEFISQETDKIHVEDAGRRIIHGEVVRKLRPDIHRLMRPHGHYLAEVSPGVTVDTSIVKVKILASDWHTKQPVANAEALPAQFFKRLEKKLEKLSSAE